eukprot:3565185-Pleurochrysis_carterae.AAC.3
MSDEAHLRSSALAVPHACAGFCCCARASVRARLAAKRGGARAPRSRVRARAPSNARASSPAPRCACPSESARVHTPLPALLTPLPALLVIGSLQGRAWSADLRLPSRLSSSTCTPNLNPNFAVRQPLAYQSKRQPSRGGLRSPSHAARSQSSARACCVSLSLWICRSRAQSLCIPCVLVQLSALPPSGLVCRVQAQHRLRRRHRLPRPPGAECQRLACHCLPRHSERVDGPLCSEWTVLFARNG